MIFQVQYPICIGTRSAQGILLQFPVQNNIPFVKFGCGDGELQRFQTSLMIFTLTCTLQLLTNGKQSLAMRA